MKKLLALIALLLGLLASFAWAEGTLQYTRPVPAPTHQVLDRAEALPQAQEEARMQAPVSAATPVVVAAPNKVAAPQPARLAPGKAAPAQRAAASTPGKKANGLWAWLTLIPLGLLGLAARARTLMGRLIRMGLIIALVGLGVVVLAVIIGSGVLNLLGGLTIFIGLVIFVVGLLQGESI